MERLAHCRTPPLHRGRGGDWKKRRSKSGEWKIEVTSPNHRRFRKNKTAVVVKQKWERNRRGDFQSWEFIGKNFLAFSKTTAAFGER